MTTCDCAKPRRQAGMATLGATVILLVLVSAIALYTSRSVLFEQRISGNDFRSRQAFEAAESGLQIALAYIGSNGGADKDSNGAIDPVFDTNNNGIGDTNTTSFTDGSNVTVTVTGAFPAFNIVAVGLSNDRTASRTVRSTGSTGDALPTSPDNPLTARGTVVINGSASVFNPEGNSTIWSGAAVDLGSNNSTHTEIADPTDAGYPSCMDTPMTCDTVTSSNRTGAGLDVIEHDTSLSNLTAEETFENFFGMSMDNYRESRVTLEVLAANVGNLATATTNPGIKLAAGQVAWVEGNTTFTNNTTSGCTVVVTGNNFCPLANQDPSIIIIHGDLTANGTPNITGLLFVTGNFYLTGNMTAMGAIVVTGNASSSGGGSLDVWYNSDVLDATRDNGPLTGAPGSWRDW